MTSIIEQAGYSDQLENRESHIHTCYEIIYLCEGSLQLEIAGREYAPKAPALIFISKMEAHSVRITGNTYKRYYLCISPLLAGNYIRDYTLLSLFSHRRENFCHVLDASGFRKDADRIFKSCMADYGSDAPFATEHTSALLTELLIYVYRANPNLFVAESSKSVSDVWKIQWRIEQDCRRDYSLTGFAEEYHLSAYYLAHLFKKVTGYSVMQYVTVCRLQLARQLLAETDLSVTEIIYRSGFSDNSNFSRFFKRETGFTPNEYRKKVKR